MNKNFLDRVTEIIDKDRVFTNEPMSKHTTFRIGASRQIILSAPKIWGRYRKLSAFVMKWRYRFIYLEKEVTFW